MGCENVTRLVWIHHTIWASSSPPTSANWEGITMPYRMQEKNWQRQKKKQEIPENLPNQIIQPSFWPPKFLFPSWPFPPPWPPGPAAALPAGPPIAARCARSSASASHRHAPPAAPPRAPAPPRRGTVARRPETAGSTGHLGAGGLGGWFLG